jgi:hypothetical protein
MHVLHEKLTPVTVAYQLLYISHDGLAVESCSKSFTDQGPRGGVIAASATVNFYKQFHACLLSDALHQDFFLRILVHEDAIDQYVLFATAYKALILCSVSTTNSIL